MSRSSEPRSPQGGRERYDVLQEFLEQHAEAVERETRLQPGFATPGRGRIVVLVALVVVFLVVWWKGSDWLGPTPPAKPTAVQTDASLRLALYLQAQRIKAFQLRTGHLPDQLGDAGPPLPGIHYEKLDAGTYVITGRNGDSTLSYRSDQPIGLLLGKSASQLGL